MMLRKLKRISPGEVLLEEFLRPLEISQNRLARDINVPVGRINGIVQGRRAITLDTALRLAVYFRMTPEFWMNLQSHYNLKLAKRKLLRKIEQSVRPAQVKTT
jgi:antitoxin HigA-1